MSGKICTYCGNPADTRDHVTPWSWNSTYRRRAKAGKLGRGQKVPACGDCNNLLNDVPIFTVEGRRAYVAERLAKEAKKQAPDWSDDELEELGPSLRRRVKARLAKRKLTQMRWNYAKGAMGS